MTPLRILFVCAEYAPLAKVGGLADVTAGLAGFLAGRGHDVRVLLPEYGNGLKGGEALSGPALPIRVYRPGEPEAAPTVYRFVCPELFPTPDVYLGDPEDGRRFVALCTATMELLRSDAWAPDIVHCHDWQTALVPVLLHGGNADGRPPARSVLTLHNLGYQGIVDRDLLESAGYGALNGLVSQDAAAAEPEQVNLLASGIRQADALTTVSPTYAREIQTEACGMGLHGLISEVSGKLTGILNGVDYSAWNPAIDTYLDEPYSAQRPRAKSRNKASLCEQLALSEIGDAPVIGLISRLVHQKGIDLLLEALPRLLAERPFGCAFLGDGDPRYVAALGRLADRHPGRVAFVRGYDEPLAHRILAGSDALLVPSLYEPCGLTQLYALRYGTIPVVRATGGLADTIWHFDPDTGMGNGCVFERANADDLTRALVTTFDWLANADLRDRLIANAMAADFSWAHQGPHYEAVYASLSL